uniref:PKD domain-containing protein n=1 Tax=Cyprinus carpio TaxID=7962 RepID=A0A8C2CG70_CYPCA
METRLVVFPGSHFTLSTWLILSSWYVFPNVKADISCAPCMSPMQVNYAGDEHLRDPPDSGKYPRQDQKKPKLITVLYPNIGVPTAREVDGFPGIAPELERNAEEINSRAPLGNFTESALDEELFSDEYVKSESELEPEDAALGRVKRSVPEFLQSADARSEEQRKTSGLRVDGQSKRAEVRWNRDDEHDSRPDEPKLTSSTFALAGDSAHNHAVVYWTGKNSSVILILTKLYDFHLGSVTESTLWRSTDYGSTYERLNDKVGVKTVLSYLYVCPTNKRKIMVLTDPEFESSILISTDEGASYQKYRLNFFVLSLLFHHTQEDWALAYSHDQKLYSSFDFGRKWQLVHERVTPNRFYCFLNNLHYVQLLHYELLHTTRSSWSFYSCFKRKYLRLEIFALFMTVRSTVTVNVDVHVHICIIFLPPCSQVAGIEGMLIANRKVENQVKTYITYNKGRDWRLLQAPTTDLAGNTIHCVLPFCSLHLQLQMSENPYLSGSISTKSSAPGVIVATGNIGSELSYNNVAMFISSDAGNNWRQIFEEEHNVWFLDKGGALVAVKQPTVPTRHLWISFDEGRQWTRHSFSAMPLFVDGVLVEAGAENQIMTFFGHFSHRSEWQLIKIDYKPIFTRRCTEGDYQTWHLHNQGEPCIMGQKQIYMKRRPGNYCMVGWDNSRILSAEPCICRAHDFEWYIFSCDSRRIILNVVANNCTKGVKEMYTARKQQCPNRPPRGLVLTTHDDKLTANMGSNVTFLVRLEEGDSMRTNIQLDFGDGTAVSYSNLSWTQEGIRHVYHSAGIFRVTALAENSLGFDMSSLHLHVTCPVEHIQLLAPYVVIKNKEVNLTAVVWPSHFRTLTYFWWLGNNTEPIITLDSSISHTFSTEGMVTVTVQVSSGDSILQDTRSIAIQEFFKSLLLSFSPNLDEANPDIPEWRQDVGRVIQKAVLQVADIPEEQLLVAVFPGIPTAAELFLLPPRNQSDGRKRTEEDLEQISEILVNALNQISVEFELKPGSRVIVYTTQLTLAPLVDSIPRHSSSAMLMLLSVVFLGLAVFLIYKFKRKIPWINIYAEVNHEKEQEMISTVGQNDATPKITLSEFSTQKELMEKELEARAKLYSTSEKSKSLSDIVHDKRC